MKTTTDQQLCDRIRLKLTDPPDDGRCVRKCETCWIEPGKLHPVKGTKFDCPDCTNGYVENRERIAAACHEWVCETYRCGGVINPGIRGYSSLDVWDGRFTEPWQAALEKHVEEWTEDAPDYDTPGGMVLLKAMLPRFMCDKLGENKFSATAILHKRTSHAEADTEHSALWQATVAATVAATKA